MSYASASSLQKAIFQRLTADAALAALVGANIFDAAPAAALPGLYLSLGEETTRSRADSGGTLATHDLALRVEGRDESFAAVKQVAEAAEAALAGAPLQLETGRLVSLRLRQARARRGRGPARRAVELIFRAIVDGA